MKKWIFAIMFLGAAMFVYMGCQQDNALASIDDLNEQVNGMRYSVQPGDVFTLKYGDVVTVYPAGFTLFFRDVTEDSRCPAAVNCVWEGRAVVQLELEALDELEIVELETPNSRNEDGDVSHFMDHSIKLLKVSPYPENTTFPIPLKQYQATFEVVRGEIGIGDDS